MQKVTLLLGSNAPDAEALVGKATDILGIAVGTIESISHDHRSAAYGFTSDREFVNRAVVLATEHDAYEVLRRINLIEALLGRDRTEEQRVKSAMGEAYASRPIDIDIIFYGTMTFNDERLTIPYHFLDQREYALRPLVDVMAEFQHPDLAETPRAMLEALTRNLE